MERARAVLDRRSSCERLKTKREQSDRSSDGTPGTCSALIEVLAPNYRGAADVVPQA